MKRIEKILLCGGNSAKHISYSHITAMCNLETGVFNWPQMSSDVSNVTGTIDWGDGTIEEYRTDTTYNHNYAEPGIYNISITLDSNDYGEQLYMSDAFRYNDSLQEIYINCRLQNVLDYAFDECSNLQIANLSGVHHIGEYAFSECTNLEKIVLDNVYSIGDWDVNSYSFNKCTSLQEVIFPPTLKTVAPYAFNCTSLRKIHFLYTPNDFQRIGIRAFNNCASLEEVIIESDLRVVNERCFEGCTALSKISLPSSILQIQSNAFYNVNRAFDIYYDGTISNWNNITKQSSWNNTCGDITVHCTDGDVIVPAT